MEYLDSTQARRNRGRAIEVDDEPGLFGDDHIPRPSGAPRTSKSQRSSNSSATSSSQKEQFTDLMQHQIALDRATNMERMERETMARVEVTTLKKGIRT
ncbi:hypothetical protein Tco_1426063 [Tanacetum coccineum]